MINWRAGELEKGRTKGFRPQRGSKPWILEMIYPRIFANGAYFHVFLIGLAGSPIFGRGLRRLTRIFLDP